MCLTVVKYLNRYCQNKTGYFFINLIGVVYAWAIIIFLMKVGAESCSYVISDCSTYVWIGYFIVGECVVNFVCFHLFSYRNRLEYFLRSSSSSTPSSSSLPFINSKLESPSMPMPPPQSSSSLFVNLFDAASSDPFVPIGESSFMKYCTKCDRTMPTRSHHCVLCRYCVMRSDHHCFALGGCVGFGNQRFFVVYLFWAICGAIFGTLMVARYVNAFVIPWTWTGPFDYFLPTAFLKWIVFQHCRFWDLGYVLVITGGYTGGTGAIMFFILQWYLIVRGQTMFELRKKRVKYESTTPLRIRIEYIFGKYWWLNFLVPVPCFRNRPDESMNRFLYECQMKKV